MYGEKSIEELARETLKGMHGNGIDRRRSLGPMYEPVQARVNKIMGFSYTKSSIDETPNFLTVNEMRSLGIFNPKSSFGACNFCDRPFWGELASPDWQREELSSGTTILWCPDHQVK